MSRISTTSRFVRVHGGATAPDAGGPGMDCAERMAPWFSALDAIRLQAVHQSVRAGLAAASRASPRRGVAPAPALADDLQRVRAALAKVIAQHTSLGTDAAADATFAPYRQRHLELQRRMDMLIAPLREHARQAVGRASARLRQLATLDATLEGMLAQRQQALLETTVQLLSDRFAQLRAGRAADSWQPDFEHHWREALAAEVELRLEPVAGLVEALRHASDDPP